MENVRSWASTLLPAVTVTWFSFNDAWITRTRACPGGVVSWSIRTCNRNPDAGPTPATV
jgi:hypothetical protein